MAYHEEIIKIYEKWLALKVEPTTALVGYPTSRYGVGYVDLDLGVESEKTRPAESLLDVVESTANMDLWLFDDAIEHLREISSGDWKTAKWENDADRCRASIMEDASTQNSNFQKFVAWQDRIINTVKSEFGLASAEVTTVEVCNVTSLFEYFDKHSYRQEPAEIKQVPVTVKDLTTTTLYVQYPGGSLIPIARSNDVSRITRFVGRIDGWGVEYASYAKTIDDGVRLLRRKLERFQSYLRNIIRTMRSFPHMLRRQCTIEKTLEGKRPI